MTMMNPGDLDSNVVGIAAFLYIIADLDQTVRNVMWSNTKQCWMNLSYKLLNQSLKLYFRKIGFSILFFL